MHIIIIVLVNILITKGKRVGGVCVYINTGRIWVGIGDFLIRHSCSSPPSVNYFSPRSVSYALHIMGQSKVKVTE